MNVILQRAVVDDPVIVDVDSAILDDILQREHMPRHI